jgi:dTDP-4-amino-4,6-dideoxygalactose transaminase
MINLFNINEYNINTSEYSNLLHDKKVIQFEEKIADYVGAKYAVTFNSATSAIFLLLLNKNITVDIPSILPPVVINAIVTSNNKYNFYDDINWVGDSYVLHNFGDYKIVDSAQKLEKNQFKKECNPEDLMIFSFYPTKPIGSCDGGMIVSDDLNKILHLKEMALNGMSFSENNWDRKIKFPGYKMYMNSIQCDIALRNFENYKSKLERLSYIREYYNENLGLNNTSSHLYRINTNDRDTLINNLKKHNVQTGIHYKSLHTHEVYKINDDLLPNSEIESLTTLSIPFHEKLTNNDIEKIIKIING